MTALDAALFHHNSGNLRDAEALYRTILRSDPRNADALHGFGVLCLNAGRLIEAEELIRAAVAARPVPEFFFHLGLALEWLGRMRAAMAAHRRALAIRPDFHEALCNLGVLLNTQGSLREAAAVYRCVLRLRSDHVNAAANLGVILQTWGKPEEAEPLFRRALAIDPTVPEILFNLSIGLEKLGRLGEAAVAARRALTARPGYVEASCLLGSVLWAQGRARQAVAAHRNAVALQPDFPEALTNLANALHSLGRLDEAIAAYGRSLAVHPATPTTRWNRALSRLLGGDFVRGWEDYEWRWHRPEFGGPPPFAQPLWRGEPSEGKTLFVHAEQGFGDSIQFIRYVPAAVERGWRVVVQAPRPLLRLLGGMDGMGLAGMDGVSLVAKDDPLPPFDAHCPMLSLPRAFGTTLRTIPAPVPYLSAEPDRVAAWGRRLASLLPGGGFRVGIAWQGNPQATIDRGRSFPLAELAPLARVPGVRLVSLQKNHGLEQLDHLPEGMAVTTLGADFDGGADAFVDAAAVMMGLDLIVTSDTALAHLAGALGRPVWLALRAVPDWRWLMAGEDSPWYPTMRLFRQERAADGDWTPVFARMAAALSALAAETAARRTAIPAEIAPGELLDKLTILDIKLDRIRDPAKRRNVEAEHALLKQTAARHLPPTAELTELTAALKAINEALWVIEDDIRDCERARDFGPRFIELARAVYHTNDRRAAVKRQINEALGSGLLEEKSYAAY